MLRYITMVWKVSGGKLHALWVFSLRFVMFRFAVVGFVMFRFSMFRFAIFRFVVLRFVVFCSVSLDDGVRQSQLQETLERVRRDADRREEEAIRRQEDVRRRHVP